MSSRREEKYLKTTQEQRLPRFLTKNMAEKLDRKTYLRVVFRETVLYVIHLIIVTAVIVSANDDSKFYLTSTVKRTFFQKSFPGVGGLLLTFKQMASMEDYWRYINTIFIDALYLDVEKNPEAPRLSILVENDILGLPRMRQVQVRNDSCTIHRYLKKLFSACFDSFEKDDEFTKSFGLKTAPEWVYSSAAETKSLNYRGRISTYTGGGYYFIFPKTKKQAKEKLKILMENKWIAHGTRAVFIDFSMYNVNVNLFTICKLIIEFPPTGGVLPYFNIRSLRLTNRADSSPLITIFKILWVGFYIFYVLRLIRQILYFRWRIFCIFWAYFSVLILTCYTIYGIIDLYISQTIDEVIKNLPEDDYGNLEYEGYLKYINNIVSGFVMFFIYLNLFQYLTFNNTMSQLNRTLRRVWNFRNFGSSMFTLLETILSDFSYANIERVSKLFAPIYFLSYIFLVFFVSLNMFLAIINDSYADVKTELAISASKMQMIDYVKGLLKRGFKKIGFKYFTTEKNEEDKIFDRIRTVLKKTGFSRRDIKKFFVKYEIDYEHVSNDPNHFVHELRKVYNEEDFIRPGDANPITEKDFESQEERLDLIGSAITKLITKVDSLVVHLDRTIEHRHHFSEHSIFF